jgi:cardiolipin synthase
MLFGHDNRLGAAALLGTLGATDWVDGYIARHFNQVSNLGKVLDPTADRLLLIVCVGAIIYDGDAPGWFSVLVVAREILVGVTLVVLTLFGMKRFDVSWYGKAGTFALMCAFPLFLLSEAGTAIDGPAHVAGWGFALPGLVLSYYAAYTYIPIARHALREGREGREP